MLKNVWYGPSLSDISALTEKAKWTKMLQLLLYSSDIFDEGLITSKFKKNENDLCKIEKKTRFLSPNHSQWIWQKQTCLQKFVKCLIQHFLSQ